MMGKHFRAITQITLIFCLILAIPFCEASESNKILLKARNFASNGDIDFSFMQYRSLLNSSADNESKAEALFACAEYHFLMLNKKAAIPYFQNFMKINEDNNLHLLALAYLYNLANLFPDEINKDSIREDILKFKRQSFVFQDVKETNIVSPLKQKLNIIFSISNIDFAVGGTSIAKISY